MSGPAPKVPAAPPRGGAPDGLGELRGYGRTLLAAVPDAAIVVVDHELRICLAAGEGFRRLGRNPASLSGRVLPDVLPGGSWATLKAAFEGALAGDTTTVDFYAGGASYSVRVSPLVMPGGAVGAMSFAQDVTEQRRLETLVSVQDTAARHSERLLATAFDRAPIGISVVDLEGRWLRVNDAYCAMLGYARDELLTKTFQDFTYPEDRGPDVEWLRAARAGETDVLQLEKRYIAKDGSVVWVDLRGELIRDDEGHPAYTVSLVENITARRASDLALRMSAERLRAILDNMPDPISVKDRAGRYELVNDAFERRFGLTPGWALGRRDDEILPVEAVALERESHDQVLRVGEPVEREEVVPHDGEDRVYRTVKFPLCDEEHRVYAVCGVFNDITERKRRETGLRERLAWTDRIHGAIAQGRLVLQGQPILEIASGRVEQAELLIRMVDEGGSSTLIAPGEFLPPAERFGLIGVIDEWVVARALEIARTRRVAVNLSATTLSDPARVAEIERLVSHSGSPPGNVTFEITETAVAENMESARCFAERLREMGCALALDDFGVGFGAFTYLKHLPVDYLKIDIQFVRDLVGDELNRQVVHAIVGVARDFGMKTIAEGVEDQATLELLGLLGADYAQGYWIGRPGPIDELPTCTTNARGS